MELKAAQAGQSGWRRRKQYWIAFFWTMALVASVNAVERIFHYYDMSVWLRALIALLPALPFAILARMHWQFVTQGDEMARHIARETYVFAFYILAAVFICTDLLRVGGILTDFFWRTKSLLYAMIGTLAAAHAWVGWRYR